MMSRMEEEVLISLQARGYHPMINKSYCLEDTRPDESFEQEGIMVYFDGEQVHKNRQEKDQVLREKLEKRYRFKVLSFPYKRYSDSKKDEIVEAIIAEIEAKRKS